MASIDKLLKFLNTTNIAESLDEEKHKEIVEDVMSGYRVDDDSRQDWLETNLEAMRIIKHCEDNDNLAEKDFPFPDSAKVIYPLLAPAIIQLASRIIPHIIRNNKTVEIAYLGKDSFEQSMPIAPNAMMMQQQAPQIQPVVKGIKRQRAERVEKFLNYEFLIESDTWLKDTHKLCHIIASWGTGFRQVYYDPITKKNCDDLIAPEDVIINHKITSLEKAPRVTVNYSLRLNDLISNMRSGYFLEIPLDILRAQSEDPKEGNPNPEEINPIHDVKKQFCYLDLDEDGYAEPYYVWVHTTLNKLLGIFPAYELEDININSKGQVISIKPRMDIVDFHLIDDPQGGFYSIGLNYLLLHQNKSITSILRQLIDSGTLANTQTGWVTSAFKTDERSMTLSMGEFDVLELTNPTINPKDHIIPAPFKEPSQVLLALLQVLIEGGKETGFITDVLTGDISGQNVPATTMLAMVEQGTRAFKPVIQKLYISLKKEFKIWFHLHSKYLDEVKYAKFQDEVVEVTRQDFNEDDMDICPVADPTQSSEAHKYARLQAMAQQWNTNAIAACNMQEQLLRFYTELDFEEPEKMILPPAPPQPDPKVMKVQVDAQLGQVQLQLEQQRIENEKLKTQLKYLEIQIAAKEAQQKDIEIQTTTALDVADIHIKKKLADIQEFDAVTNRQRAITEKNKKD